jgi:serine kinase of HPr protein (carbohydrate metabolism regulator)
MKKKLTLKEIFQGSSSALGIKEIFFNAGSKKEILEIKIRFGNHGYESHSKQRDIIPSAVRDCSTYQFRGAAHPELEFHNKIPFALSKNLSPFIGIISPQALSQLSMIDVYKYGKIQECLFPRELLFLFITNSSAIPDFFKKYLKKYKISAAASGFDKYYLKSCLIRLFREKLQETVYFHGAVFETSGKGILLTGASGIGKTTAVFDYVRKNNYWVADDFALVSKNIKGELVAESHKKIRNLVHTSKTGIISVHKLLNHDRIKKNTRLSAVIEVTRDETSDYLVKRGKKQILKRLLPCLHINIPQGSYFDKNLLKKCVEQLFQDMK